MILKQELLKPVADYSWEGNTGESIVLHITAGSNYKGARDTLIARHLSYHFIVDTDGKIYQLVDIKRSAWHAGVKSNPNTRVRKFFGDTNPNRRSIGISFVAPLDTWFSDINDQQLKSAVELIKYIGSTTGVRYNASNIFSHGEITDYKEKMLNECSQVINELVGYKDEKDVVVLQSTIDKLRALIKKLTNGK